MHPDFVLLGPTHPIHELERSDRQIASVIPRKPLVSDHSMEVNCDTPVGIDPAAKVSVNESENYEVPSLIIPLLVA